MTRLLLAGSKALSSGARESRAEVEVGRRRFELTYRVSSGLVSGTASPFVAASLLPAMRIGQPLGVEGTISPRLESSIPTIQGLMSAWFERVAPIEIRGGSAPEPVGSGVASFFSGGIDSWYTALRHLDEISALVFVTGFDIQPRDSKLQTRATSVLRSAAARLGKPLIEVETNVRAFADRFTGWSEEYHGSALASVALLLSPQFSRVYIPATFPPGYNAPWGSHKDLDPLWSTEATEIVHDGADAPRIQKARLVAASDIAMQTLRVCWENRGGQYNCGRCEKCVRTMANLRIAGALERCATFRGPLDMSAVARVDIPDECARVFVKENLAAAQEIGDEELAQALSAALSRHPTRLSDVLDRGDLVRRVYRGVRQAMGWPTYDWRLSRLAGAD